MKAISKSTGAEIIGTLEVVQGVAEITPGSFVHDKDGAIDFDYGGNTDIWWEEQRTIVRDGERIFVDQEGNEYPESDLALVAEAADGL